MDTHTLLDVDNLSIQFSQGLTRPPFTAVNNVSFHIAPGETLGLVGESGSGKSTIGNAILGLVRSSAGRIRFEGEDITHAQAARRRDLSRDLQMVFQDPYSSLNPARTIGQTLAEPLLVHENKRGETAHRQIGEMLERVGLSPMDAAQYPVAFSGGQRQRIAIARALMLSPKLVICDEPVSGLDLSTQAQVLNLLLDLQKDLGLSYLFVSHDLAVVRYVSQRLIILRRGEIVESGPAREVLGHPKAEYTRRLLNALPYPDTHIQSRRRVCRIEAVGAARQR